MVRQLQPSFNDYLPTRDTTDFSRVELQLQPTHAVLNSADNTDFRRVVLQLQPTLRTTFELTSPKNLMTPHLSSSIAAYQLHFYLWFKTHYRRPLLLSESSTSLVHDVLSEVCTRQEYHLLDADVAKDCLRLLVSLKPEQSVAQTVKFLKGNISKQFGLAFPDLLKAHSSRSRWARGYFARSSGKVNLTNARNYVDSQAAHHGYQGKWTRPLKFRNPNFKSPAFSFDHTLCQLDYHIVVATQNRLPLFDETIATPLFNYILAIGRKHHFAVDRIGLMPDHMHLIVEAVSQSEC